MLDHKGIVGNCWTGALAHLGIARANALQAKTARGADADAARVRSAYKDFLTYGKTPIPMSLPSGKRKPSMPGRSKTPLTYVVVRASISG